MKASIQDPFDCFVLLLCAPLDRPMMMMVESSVRVMSCHVSPNLTTDNRPQADERRYREICAMDDDQDELLEPLGLGLTLDSSSPSAAAAAAGGGDPRGSSSSSSSTKIKYAIEV